MNKIKKPLQDLMSAAVLHRERFMAYGSLALIMAVLGASDALRGIFAPVFESHFVLTSSRLATIVTVSYVGNLVFLLYGGRLIDRFPIKRIFLAVSGMWMLSLCLYLFTDSYWFLLVGMFVSMGASTLMNTMVNIMAPILFSGASAMTVNTLFFAQGIGTTGSQKIAGMYAGTIGSWKAANLILLGIGAVGAALFLFARVPEKRYPPDLQGKPEKSSYKEIVKNPAFLYLIFILGFYFVAEHGILNWLVSYASKSLGFPISEASGYLSIFFGGIMVGRLVFAPVVQRLGIMRSITVFGGIGMGLYGAGIVFGKNTLLLLSAAGLFFSVLYPTLIMMIQLYYGRKVIGTATGLIISAATLFDIGFNILFGKAIDVFGFENSFLILPVCMVLFYVCFLMFRRRRL